MIEAIKNGNTLAFEKAYIMFREKLFAWFLKKTKSHEDAKDLLQITFSKLWQYRQSLSENYLLDQHLFHIAKTVFIDYLRRENKLQKVKTSVKQNIKLELSDEHIHEFDTGKRLQKALSKMPALRKRVFELHKIEGYSYKEIAEILSITVKSVDNNLTKAVKYLRSVELLVIIFTLAILH